MKKIMMGFGVGSLLFFMQGTTFANIQSYENFSKNPKNIQILDKAFDEMKKRNNAAHDSKDFRTSLQYWANIHGYFAEDLSTDPNAKALKDTIKNKVGSCFSEAFKNKAKEEIELCITYTTYYTAIRNQTVLDDKIAQDVWGTCPHSSKDVANDMFLPWHRLYLHFFNKTLKKASGSAEFVLPYWKYEDNYDEESLSVALPTQFTEQDKSIYSQYRTKGLNKGQQSINAYMNGKGEGVDILGSEALKAEKFFSNERNGFSNLIEQDPHGMMHCGVGANCIAPYMGVVPAAGNDPIFYLHHRNIDRLWQKWMETKSKGKEITLEWAKKNLGMDPAWFEKEMSFVDENGNKVTVKVADAFSSEYMPKYEELDLKNTEHSLGALKAISSPLGSHESFDLKSTAILGQMPDKINLAIPAKNLKSNLNNKPAESFLKLENIELKNNPLLTYGVYLVNKENSKKSYLMTFSYFGVDEGGHGHHSGAKLNDVELNISDNLQEIGATNFDQLQLIFRPTDLTTKPVFTQQNDAGITIGKISFYSKPLKE
ncbi:tyrosinase family protein [Acinetobacter sp. TY2]|uniref:tyrosinase family protein n=1 Tax=Acinetobacter sp. TY2 TaxID=3387403 RepID=UPI003917A0BA